MINQAAWLSFQCYVGSKYGTFTANVSFGKTALSALTFTRLVSKAFSWGLDDECAQPCCHSLVWEQEGGGPIKEGFLPPVCPVNFPLIQRRTCSSVKRGQFCTVRRNNMTPPITTVAGNSTVPTLVCLTPKAVQISVKCSKVNTGENWPWGEVIAQDELRKEWESSVSFWWTYSSCRIARNGQMQ